MGYIITIDNSEITIIDNMDNCVEQDILNEISIKMKESNLLDENITNISKENLMLKAENKNKNSKIELKDEFNYYYTKNKNFYYVINLTITDSNSNETNLFYDEQID